MLIIRASHVFADVSDDQKIIKFFQTRFEFDGAAEKGSTVSEIFSGTDIDRMGLRSLVQLDLRMKDLWGNRDYIFGYGALRDGSIVMAAWKNRVDAQNIALKELSGIYTDERLAVVQDDKGLTRWRKAREEVAGAFINVRKSEARVSHVFPFSTAESVATTGRESLSQLVLSDRPIVVRFLPRQTPQKLRNLLTALPER